MILVPLDVPEGWTGKRAIRTGIGSVSRDVVFVADDGADLDSLCDLGDWRWGDERNAGVYRINGRFVVRASTWGEGKTAEEAAKYHADRISPLMSWCGVKPGVTLSACVRKLFRKYADDIGVAIVGDTPQLSRMLYESIHPGPIVHVRGMVEGGHYDRRKAYLAGLYGPVAVPGTWRNLPVEAWDLAGPCDVLCGMLRQVAGESTVPPLAYRDRLKRQIYPEGWIIGAWPVRHVREWVGRGLVEDVRPYWLIGCRASEWCAGWADFARGLPDDIGKPLYQRLWGTLCSSETTESVYTDKITDLDGKLAPWRPHWETRKRDKTDPHKVFDDSMFLPGLSSTMVADNFAATMRQIQDGGEIGAAHVDSVWCQRRPALTTVPGGWRRENEGFSCHFAPGHYFDFDDNGGIKAAKAQGGEVTESDLTKATGALRARKTAVEYDIDGQDGINIGGRLWTADPKDDLRATSRPIVFGEPDDREAAMKPMSRWCHNPDDAEWGHDGRWRVAPRGAT